MPQQTKKKTTAAKPASNSKKPSTRKKQDKPAVRREVWAGVCLFLSFVAFLSFFGVKGFVIRWYDSIIGGLIGDGVFVMPFALLGAGILLIVHRKGKARLRWSCIMLLPLLWGALRHLLINTESYGFGIANLKALATSGAQLKSGGLLSGGLAILLRAALSNVGGIVLCILLMIICITGAMKITPAVLRRFWSRFHMVPEEEEPAQTEIKLPPRPAAKRAIDIQIDDDTACVTKKPFFKSRTQAIAPPNVPTPAEALLGQDKTENQAPKVERFDPVAPVTPVYDKSEAQIKIPNITEEAAKPAEPAQSPDEPPVEEQIKAALEAETGTAPSYLYPPLSLLHEGKGRPKGAAEATQEGAEKLIDTLQSFGIEANVIDVTSGPSVTRYELQLQRGTKVSRVTNLSDDVALTLGATGVRVSTIPNKNAVGIEVPNIHQELVTARDILSSQQFKNHSSKLAFAVGKDISGQCIVGDIAKMPHMLIAGTTGSGKSVCINSILISLLYKAKPEDVRLIMVDPKMIELGVYNGIPHLLIPVVTDARKAAGALNWAVSEMMRRYKLFSETGARDLKGYNAEMLKRPEGEALPQIVIVIDELSDLMAVARNEVEEAIIRIAQMARAAGMHLIIATQRPSADVITGLMKTNIPSRIAFAVASQIDSRIILDQTGAEKLIGKGDMLYSPLGGGKPQRIQGCFVTDGEVEEVVNFVKQSGVAQYSEEIMEHIEKQAESGNKGSGGGGFDNNGAGDDDELLPNAIEIVVNGGQASTSMLQRRLKLGYARASRLIDQMEERGIVGPFEGSKPREVRISKEEWQEMELRRKD